MAYRSGWGDLLGRLGAMPQDEEGAVRRRSRQPGGAYASPAGDA